MIITTNLVTSRKAESVMRTYFCPLTQTRKGGSWGEVRPELTGEVSVLTVADRDRTVFLAATDQLVPGTRAWSPPT
jgi:hypothetical protein